MKDRYNGISSQCTVLPTYLWLIVCFHISNPHPVLVFTLVMPHSASTSKSAFRKVRGKVKNTKFATKSTRPAVVDTSYSLGPNGRLQPLEQSLVYPEDPQPAKRTRLASPHEEELAVDPLETTSPAQLADGATVQKLDGSGWEDVETEPVKNTSKRKGKVRHTLVPVKTCLMFPLCRRPFLMYWKHGEKTLISSLAISSPGKPQSPSPAFAALTRGIAAWIATKLSRSVELA